MLSCWLAAAALGAPVELPTGEDPALWAHPLALAGLEAGELGGAAGARIVASGATWRVLVVDENGADHLLAVARPDDRADREALAALVASLIHPVSLPSVALPTLPPPAPRPRPPAPQPASRPAEARGTAQGESVAAPVVPAEGGVESVGVRVGPKGADPVGADPVAVDPEDDPVAVVEGPDPARTAADPVGPRPAGLRDPVGPRPAGLRDPDGSSASQPADPPRQAPIDAPIRAPAGLQGPPRSLVELEDPPAAPARLGWWAGGGPSVRVRSGVRSGVGLGGWGGLSLDQRWRLGVGVEGVAPAGLSQPFVGYRVAVVDVRAVGAWSPRGWELGPTAGLSWRLVDPPEFTTTTSPGWGCADGPDASCSAGPFPFVGAMVARRAPLGPVAARLGLVLERDLRPVRLHQEDQSGLGSGWSATLSASVWTR